MKRGRGTWLVVAGVVALAPIGSVIGYESSSAPAEKAQAKWDIIDTAVSAGSFKTLAAALQAAGLVQTLKGPGPFTVFAPTDAAFEKLPAGTLNELLKPENKAKLTNILTYHVVSGKAGSSDVVNMPSAKTIEGQSIMIKVLPDGTVMANNAKVVKTDIACSNGVIHVIDTVLMPSTNS